MSTKNKLLYYDLVRDFIVVILVILHWFLCYPTATSALGYYVYWPPQNLKMSVYEVFFWGLVAPYVVPVIAMFLFVGTTSAYHQCIRTIVLCMGLAIGLGAVWSYDPQLPPRGQLRPWTTITIYAMPWLLGLTLAYVLLDKALSMVRQGRKVGHS